MAPDDRPDETADERAVQVVDGSSDPPGAAVAEFDDDGVDPVAAPVGKHRSKLKKHSPLRTTIEWVIVLGAAVCVALILRTFVLSAFYIPSGSMEPTLNVGDRVLVNKLSYKLHDVNRGDIVVFERPPGETDSSIKDLIKRVIGLPGETVEGVDGVVYVCEEACAKPAQEGRPLEEGYVQCPDSDPRRTFEPVTLGEEQVWVMGDNRCGSSDSRVFGAIDTDSIVGRAFVIVWPITDMGWL